MKLNPRSRVVDLDAGCWMQGAWSRERGKATGKTLCAKRYAPCANQRTADRRQKKGF
ncbi:hypothetical protein ACFL6B_01715 [Thermodesulfobacteriota bacterium]